MSSNTSISIKRFTRSSLKMTCKKPFNTLCSDLIGFWQQGWPKYWTMTETLILTIYLLSSLLMCLLLSMYSRLTKLSSHFSLWKNASKNRIEIVSLKAHLGFSFHPTPRGVCSKACVCVAGLVCSKACVQRDLCDRKLVSFTSSRHV